SAGRLRRPFQPTASSDPGALLMRLRFFAVALAAVGSLAVADRASAQVYYFGTPIYYGTPYNPLVRTYSAAVYHSNYSYPRVVPTYVVPTYSAAVPPVVTASGAMVVQPPGSSQLSTSGTTTGTTGIPTSGTLQSGVTTAGATTISGSASVTSDQIIVGG